MTVFQLVLGSVAVLLVPYKDVWLEDLISLTLRLGDFMSIMNVMNIMDLMNVMNN